MLEFIIDFLRNYGGEILTAFLLWFIRKFEKPKSEKNAIKNFVQFTKLYKGNRLQNGAPTTQPDELLKAFFEENPQYKEKSRARNA